MRARRAHHVAEGHFDLDPRNLAPADIPVVADALTYAAGRGSLS